MSEIANLLLSIADTINDYRTGEIRTPTADHVDHWLNQFDASVHEPLLFELNHVLERTYLSKDRITKFLSSLVQLQELTGPDPIAFWNSVNLMDIQESGGSQRAMLRILQKCLLKAYGNQYSPHEKASRVYIYLDDGIFTGTRVRNDLEKWITFSHSGRFAVHVIAIAYHLQGARYASERIQETGNRLGKRVDLEWWGGIGIEDRQEHLDSSDVLRPTVLPKDELTRRYVAGLKYALTLRRPGHLGKNEFFSSETGRHILEQELLKAGLRIRSMVPNLNLYQRPLGNMVLQTLGFGCLHVTYRNCPNNCPLAFWAGDPWYPLFPRRTNS